LNLKEVWLIDYARTAFSRSRPEQPERDVFGEIRGDELLANLLIKFFDGKLADKRITKSDIEEASVGIASGVLENWTYGGKIPLFLSGFPNEVSSFMIDKQCASAGAGMHALIMHIMTGNSKRVLATGFEHMTRVRRVGIEPEWDRFTDKNSKFYNPNIDIMNSINMLQTAQRLYEEEVPRFTKEDLDKFGVRSHNLTVKNQETGWFKGEIIPIEGHVGTEEGVITAGNSSPLNAGATAAVLMEAEEARKRGLEPMARIVSIGWAAVDPRVMGRGPVPASRKALDYAGLQADDIDYWEINEAFCIVALNCMDKFNIPEEKVNVMGGSTAIGHPLGSTVIRLTGTLARILKDKKAKYGVANACVGGGQGTATVIENLDA